MISGKALQGLLVTSDDLELADRGLDCFRKQNAKRLASEENQAFFRRADFERDADWAALRYQAVGREDESVL